MFREAQARASKVSYFFPLISQPSGAPMFFVQVIEEQLKGLPDVKGTKYMEMGRHQMEVFYFLDNYPDCKKNFIVIF